MRAIEGIEIVSPSSSEQVRSIAESSLKAPKLRYVRLERSVAERLAGRVGGDLISGVDELRMIEGRSERRLTILSSGYLLNRAIDAAETVSKESGWSIQILDVWKIKPINLDVLYTKIKDSEMLITLEEQARDGSFGAAILEATNDLNLLIPTLRLSLSSAFAFENGTRDELLDYYGLSNVEIETKILEAIGKKSKND
jgi:transketolase C-terminal domain/subunit